MKPSGIGGMAVIEGVMMKNKDEYAVAVRKPNNEIAVEKKTHKDFADKVKLFKLPIFRGMLAFVDSMVIGIKVLNYSASFFEEEEEKEVTDKKSSKKTDKKAAKTVDSKAAKEKNDESSNALLMAAAVVVSLAFSIGFFMVLPVLVTNLFTKIVTGRFWIALIEGVLRLLIFIGYILVASQMKEIKRVFMYHGAEHKTINCLENGFELTVENVRWQSKQHKRCGTSFMLLVMLISLVLFMAIQPSNLLWKVLSRVLLIPLVAGLSYEFIRLSGKTDNVIINILSQPGLWMQRLTTKEPDDSMIEVAIQSVDAVFDWRGFVEAAPTAEKAKKSSSKKESKPKSVAKPVSQAAEEQDKTQASKSKNADNSQTKSNTQVKNVPAAGLNNNVHAKADEEDDEILKALDKYLDFNDKDASK